MQAPDPIEAALARLMPTAMSMEGQRSLEDLIDSLAAENPVVSIRRPWLRPAMGIGAAAALALAFTLPSMWQTGREMVQSPQVQADVASLTGVFLVDQSERVESVDEGWVADPDGSTMQAVRMRMVSEDVVRDSETGYTVKVAGARDEITLMPVSDF